MAPRAGDLDDETGPLNHLKSKIRILANGECNVDRRATKKSLAGDKAGNGVTKASTIQA